METLTQTIARNTAFIAEKAPNTDLAPSSVLNELVVGLTSQAQTALANTVTDIAAGGNIQAVLASPTDTFNPVIDSLASNYGVTRNPGSLAQGTIKVVVNRAKTYYIPQGFTFIQPSLNFSYVTTANYTINSTSVPPLVQTNETWSFVIPVVASSVGAEQQVSFGTAFALGTNSSLPEFISASAAGAFTSGANQETDKELITRFKLGLSTANLISTNAIQSVLQDRFPNFVALSLRSAGDPEEIRTGNNPFNLVLPGLVDVYIRMCYALPTVVVTKVGVNNGDGSWSVTLNPTDAPGFYKVLSVVPSGNSTSGTLALTGVVYDFDASLYNNKNNVSTVAEARFTQYQKATITFPYVTTLPTPSFDLTVMVQPNLADVQALFLNPATRIPGADYLVKGIVPCDVSIAINLVKLQNPTINTPLIQADVYNYVNRLPMGEPVSASKIASICHNYPINRVDLPILMTGTIYAPFASTDIPLYISGSDTLAIPNLPKLGVTPYTSAFFANYFDSNGNATIGVSTT